MKNNTWNWQPPKKGMQRRKPRQSNDIIFRFDAPRWPGALGTYLEKLPKKRARVQLKASGDVVEVSEGHFRRL